MKLRLLNPSAADRNLLDAGRHTRAMRWVMAVMLFLTVLAGALGLGMVAATSALDRQLGGRLTVQIIEPDTAARDRDARAIVAALGKLPDVAHAAEADRARLAELLRPWLGDAGLDPELPMPAMIDVELVDGSAGRLARAEAAVRAVRADARVDRAAQWLAPVRGFMLTMTWLAGGLVLLMAAATAAMVLLVARAGLDTHRDTIEVLHMLGSTDVQLARLFQRRIALDTLLGGVLGTLAAAGLVAFLQTQLAAVGSEMLGGVALQQRDWFVLLLLPLAFSLMATVAARVTVLRALRKTL